MCEPCPAYDDLMPANHGDLPMTTRYAQLRCFIPAENGRRIDRVFKFELPDDRSSKADVEVKAERMAFLMGWHLISVRHMSRELGERKLAEQEDEGGF